MDALTAAHCVATALGYPSKPDLYKGKESRYVTYNYALLDGDNYGDDAPGCNVAEIQVHLFMPLKENFLHRMNEMQKALFDAGFTWPEITILTEYDEVETQTAFDGVRHIVFECEYEEDLKEE